MKAYLVQKGQYKSSSIVSAKSEKEAVRKAFEGLSWGSDFDYDVLVIELPKGTLYTVDRELDIRPK